MKCRVVGNERDGFKVQYRRGDLWRYVTVNGVQTWPKRTVRTFSTRESAEALAKLYAESGVQ